MKKFKRSFSIVLALLMIASFAPMAFASSTPTSGTDSSLEEEKNTTYTFEPNIDNDNTDVVYVTYATERAGASVGAAVAVPAYTAATPTFGLDLTNEKLINGDATTPAFSYAGYSVDGGGKWKKGSVDAKVLSGLLKKGGTLWLASVMNAKGNGPEEGAAEVAESEAGKGDGKAAVTSATIVKFAAIEAAPKKPAYIPNYALKSSKDDADDGYWTLSSKDKTDAVAEDLASLIVAWAKDGKNVTKLGVETGVADSGYEYGKFPTDGICVGLTTGDKVGKQTYFVRYTATLKDGKYTPGSAIAKVKVSDQIKAPKLKPDYKKEVLKLKADTTIQFQGTAVSTAVTAGTDGFAVPAAGGTIYATKENAKSPALLGTFLTEDVTEVHAFSSATVKKPASAYQVITLAARAVLSDVTFTPDKGKVKPAKTLEFYDATKKKYGGFPKVTGAYTGTARLKSTAKVTKTGVTGNAASADGALTVTWGKFVSGKTEKDGITAAELISKDYHNGDYVLYLDPKSVTSVKDASSTADLTIGVKNVPTDEGATPTSFVVSVTASGTSFSATVSSLDLTAASDSLKFKGLALPSFKVEKVPVGVVKVTFRALGATADTTVTVGEVKIEPTDDEKVAIAAEKINAITGVSAKDAAAAKTAVETAITALKLVDTYKLDGLTTTVTAPTGDGPWTVKVAIKSGAKTAEASVSVTVASASASSMS